ncbi:hypothetical protein U1Q18_022799 [Sarracenia purpurea var. burkii]
MDSAESRKNSGKGISTHMPVVSSVTEDKTLPPGLPTATRISYEKNKVLRLFRGQYEEQSAGGAPLVDELEDTAPLSSTKNKDGLKRSSSISPLKVQPSMKKSIRQGR